MAALTVMTPEREALAWQLLEAGASRKEAATALGISEAAAGGWAKRVGRQFEDARRSPKVSPARKAAALRNLVRAREARRTKGERGRLPDMTPEDRNRYKSYRRKILTAGLTVTRDDAFRAIGRDDLVGWQG